MYDGNVAFKLNWIEGKRGPFRGPCTSEARKMNIDVLKRTWCSCSDCPCSQIREKEKITGRVYPPVDDDSVCYEAGAFRNKRFWTGVYHNGPKRDELIPMVNAKPGKLAFLTSRGFDDPEDRRIVIASYEIERVELDESWSSTAAFSKPGTWVAVADPARSPLFWKFHKQSAGPSWGTGLFRYLTDPVAQKLQAAVVSAAL